ncbi:MULTISPECIES: hypothetical protein [unclassified Microcoleus]|nr:MULTISPECIES: hypothetical protein [unclassified Microcoleus]
MTVDRRKKLEGRGKTGKGTMKKEEGRRKREDRRIICRKALG